ncbi:MAG: O-antigen ligase family protein, partial [bacterium]|nr:O-antigen ligase family protein [bacterium]
MNFTFRILVEIALGAWVLLMFIDAKYRPRFSWILVAAGTFLAVIALADFMGINPYRSFWSNYERMEGLVTHIHLFLYFIIAGSVFATEQMWKWFWRTSLVASLFIAFNAYGQLVGWGAVHQSSNRMDATLGNSTYLAVYALFHAFLAMFLFFRDREKHPRAALVYPAIALVNVAVLYYTQTRGAFLGLVGGIFLALLLAALFDREHPERRKYAIGGVVGAGILIAAFFVWKDAAWIQNNRTLGRIADISITDQTTQSRFMIWNMSFEGWKEHPILGWGQDNFLYVFAKHYNPKMYNQEPWFDRSHDVFFDWLIAGGALGLLTYLSLFGAALYYLWLIPLRGTPDPALRGLGFKRPRHFTVIESGVLTGMLAGYFVHNIFVFDNLTSYLLFFAFLGYLHTLHAEPLPTATPPHPHKKRGREEEELGTGDLAVAVVIVVALTAGAVYLLNIRNIKANIALIDAIRPESIFVDGPGGQKEIALENVLKQRLFGTGEAREQLAQLALQTADPR